jgi:hypothetical protein
VAVAGTNVLEIQQWRTLQPLSPGPSLFQRCVVKMGGISGSSWGIQWINRISRDSFSKDRRKSPLLWYNLCLGLPCEIRASCAPSLT